MTAGPGSRSGRIRQIAPHRPIPADIRRLLIVCPNWVGDMVMATPILRAAREALPDAGITGVMMPPLEDLIAGTGWLDDVVLARSRLLGETRRIAAAMRSWRPEAVLILPNSFRAALIGWLTRAPVRLGYATDVRGLLLTEKLHWTQPGPRSTVGTYSRLGEWALGLPSIDPRMELAVTPQQHAAAAEVLREVPRPFVLLSPGASRTDKRWPAERFAAVADRLAADHGLAAAVTGAPPEDELARQVVESASCTVHNLVRAGMSLGALKGVIREARLLVTNDTGPRHLAAALGTPVVTLFGPTDRRWTPIDCRHEAPLVADPFLPGELTADDHPLRCAITRISVGDVVTAAASLLERDEGAEVVVIRSTAREDAGVGEGQPASARGRSVS